MMHSFFNNTFLAARGEKEWFDILIPIAIAVIYMIVAALRKKGENQQGGSSAEKPRSSPPIQSRRQEHANPAAIRQAAQREYDEAKELASRQFDARMERIREYEENKPAGVPDAVWQKQIENARRTVQNEYEDAQQRAREEYQRVISRLPAATPPPARKTPPKPQPVAVAKPPTKAQPVAYEQPASQPQEKSFQHETAATISTAHRAEPAKVLAHHLSFAKDDLTKGILYSEILGKPLALRDDA